MRPVQEHRRGKRHVADDQVEAAVGQRAVRERLRPDGGLRVEGLGDLGRDRVQLHPGDRHPGGGETDEVPRPAARLQHPSTGRFEPEPGHQVPHGHHDLGRGVVGVDGGPPGRVPLPLRQQRPQLRRLARYRREPGSNSSGADPHPDQRARTAISPWEAARRSVSRRRTTARASRLAAIFAPDPAGARSFWLAGRNETGWGEPASPAGSSCPRPARTPRRSRPPSAPPSPPRGPVPDPGTPNRRPFPPPAARRPGPLPGPVG